MNKYVEKCQKITKHLCNHPADWQTKISLLKMESKALQYEMDQKKYQKLAQLAQIRRKQDEK